MATPDKPGLSDLFQTFTTSAFRMETLQVYAVPQEDSAWQAFLRGRPLPHRTPDNNPWLRRIADYTAAGRKVSRAHIVDWPLTAYLRFELLGYRQNALAGEDIVITPREAHPELAALRTDWWLFDDTDLVFMHYTENGEYLGAEVAPAETDISLYQRQRDLALHHGLPLDTYLNSHREYRSA